MSSLFQRAWDGMALGFPVVVLALRFLVERTEPVFVSKALEKPLLRHEVFCARPPLFGEVSHCLALIPGESLDSGLGPGLDALAFLRVVKKDLPCN